MAAWIGVGCSNPIFSTVETISALSRAMPFVRHELGRTLRLKRIPDLHVELDDTAERPPLPPANSQVFLDNDADMRRRITWQGTGAQPSVVVFDPAVQPGPPARALPLVERVADQRVREAVARAELEVQRQRRREAGECERGACGHRKGNCFSDGIHMRSLG